MDARALNEICKKVYLRFPEVNGSRPGMKDYSETSVLLVFKGSAKTADGRTLPRTVRVVATKDGKITKMTTSRG